MFFFSYQEYYQSDYQRQNPPAHYRHSQLDLTEWDESNQNPHHMNNNNGHSSNHASSYHQPPHAHPNRRSIGGNSERDLYQYRNGNAKGSDPRDEWEDVDRRRNENRCFITKSRLLFWIY